MQMFEDDYPRDNSRWITQSYPEASQLAQQCIRKSTTYLNLKAHEDAEAQAKARTAAKFYQGFKKVFGWRDSEILLGGQGCAEGEHGSGEATGDTTGNATRDETSTSQTEGKAVPLPHELHLRIISFVDKFDDKWRGKTLASLCATSSITRHFAESFLYTRPPDLDTVEQQWRFLFTLTIQPRLQTLVCSLYLRWWMRSENAGLLADIVQLTPNLEALTLFHTGPDGGFYTHEVVSHHVTDLASLLEACPRVATFEYYTDMAAFEDVPDNGDNIELAWGFLDRDPWNPHEEAAAEKLLKDARFATFARQLTRVHLEGETKLIEKALVPHLSSNLREFALKYPRVAVDTVDFLMDLPNQCPHVEKLWVFPYVADISPALTACLGWVNTLRDLYIGHDVSEFGEFLGQWIPQNLSKMVALQRLELDMNCWTETFGLISKHHPPRLTSLRIKSLSNRDNGHHPRLSAVEGYELAKDNVELHLCHLIVSLKETLESIHVGRLISHSPMPASKSVLNICKQAPNLVEFWAVPGRDAISSDVDDLLDTCPNLCIFPPKFTRWTWREDEWTERKKMVCMDENDERLEQFRTIKDWRCLFCLDRDVRGKPQYDVCQQMSTRMAIDHLRLGVWTSISQPQHMKSNPRYMNFRAMARVSKPPKARNHHGDWNAFQSQSREAGKKLWPLTKLIEDAARLSPDHVEAQQRAKAVADFYSDVDEFAKHEYVAVSARQAYAPVDEEPSVERAEYLPMELYHQILRYVDGFSIGSRQRTFTALAASCSKLRTLAEPYLYNHPPDIVTVDRQWRLLFTLTVNPRLADLVWSLDLFWWGESHNQHLLEKILAKTPNIRSLTFRRGPEEQLNGFARLQRIDANFISRVMTICTALKSFNYLTTEKEVDRSEMLDPRYWTPAGPQDIDSEIADALFEERRPELTQLTLEGTTSHIEQLLLPLASSKLRYLSVRHGLEFGDNPRVIGTLARRTPSLQSFSIVASNSRLTGILQALDIWSSTLRSLTLVTWRLPSDDKFKSFDDVLPKLTALEEVTFGWRFPCTVRTLETLAKTEPLQRFKSLYIRRLLLEAGEDPQTRAECFVSEFLRSHSSTLTSLKVIEGLNGRAFPGKWYAGPRVFRSCQQAPKLKQLWLLPTKSVKPSDIDALLETCPDLNSIPIELMKLSEKEFEWAKHMIGNSKDT